MGIDPGLKGGVAALGYDSRQSGEHEVVAVRPMPVRKTGKSSQETVDALALSALLADFCRNSSQPLIALEKVGAMRKGGRPQGATSMFTFGMGYGKVLAVLEILSLPLIQPRPQDWQRVVLRGRGGDPKEAAVAYCLSRYPSASLRPTARYKTDSSGLADALCLAEYALRQTVRRIHEEGA